MEMSLKEIKKTEFAILKHFQKFCYDNNIKFYLSNGTLLGAIKYNGFIPWDDDIDVLVPRKDYDRLIAIYMDCDEYKLFSLEREPMYKFPFAKLCDMSTVKIEENIDNGVTMGLEIDIFPIDSCSKHVFRLHSSKRLRLYQIGCMLSKFISSKGKAFYKRIIINCCRILGFKYFCNRLIKAVEREASLGEDYRGCLVWPVYGEREIMPAEVFSDTVEVEFEGEQFPAPIGYDTYLRSLYGDYEKDPPLEKQRSHHKYTAYRI